MPCPLSTTGIHICSGFPPFPAPHLPRIPHRVHLSACFPQAILQRIQDRQPYYNHMEWHSQRTQNEKYIAMISQFPEQYEDGGGMNFRPQGTGDEFFQPETLPEPLFAPQAPMRGEEEESAALPAEAAAESGGEGSGGEEALAAAEEPAAAAGGEAS